MITNENENVELLTTAADVNFNSDTEENEETMIAEGRINVEENNYGMENDMNITNCVDDEEGPDLKEPVIPAKKKKRSSAELANKHPVLGICSCKRMCYTTINPVRQGDINKQYWGENFDMQRQWIFNSVKEGEIKRKIVKDENSRKKNRDCSREYSLPTEDGVYKRVCQKFYLNTLGYTSDKKIISTFKATNRSDLFTPQSTRGKHRPKNKKSDDVNKMVEEHINSFHPSISHYRRKHAPFRLYLSPDLNITLMYHDFNSKNPRLVSREFYRQKIKKMNISFCRLGEEECEMCLAYEAHIEVCNKKQITDVLNEVLDTIDQSEIVTSERTVDFQIESVIKSDVCELCFDWREHIYYASVTRTAYENDRDVMNHDPTTRFCSTDMQKVILLPVMTGVKTSISTRRLVTFHQTFSPLGSGTSVGVIWNESISGRNDEDLASVYIRFISDVKNRDYKHIVLWADNCSAQNKN